VTFAFARLNANGSDGLRLGYLDVATGDIVLEVTDPGGAITVQLQDGDRALLGPPVHEGPHGNWIPRSALRFTVVPQVRSHRAAEDLPTSRPVVK
jgi:hypothetical protein